MTSFTTLVRTALRDLYRSRIVILPLVLLGFAVLGGFVPDAASSGAQDTDAVGASFAEALAVMAILVGIAAGCGAVSEELTRGTLLLLGTRPVSRITFVLAKAVAAIMFAGGFLLAWTLAFSSVLALRGFGSEVFLQTLQSGALRVPSVALLTVIAVCASTILGTRMAFGFGILAWLVGWFSGQSYLLFKGNEPIVELVSRLEPIVAAMTYVIPIRRLDDWAAETTGNLAASTYSATGRELPVIYGDRGDLLIGMIAIGAWLAIASIVFRQRRSLV
jgi:ABC-type transport system involved in multi-copper enzyme maturation permease subunit